MENKKYICPVCKANKLLLKHEASYVYSYVLDSDAPGFKNKEIFSPYLYDRRDQTESFEYIECSKCKSKFDYDIFTSMKDV
ncbi:MAG: hypothetical protein GX237_03670 [Clostridiales bacterium]|nr:hypothetical protein [Clostridiales bacterium]